MKQLHESGCFYFSSNKVFLTKLPPGVKALLFYMPSGKILKSVNLRGKTFHLNDEHVIMEIELDHDGDGFNARYFYYNKNTQNFIEVDESWL